MAEETITPPKFKTVPMETIPQSVQDTAPKRGRPPRDPNAPRQIRKPRIAKSLETQIGAALMTFNLGLWAIPATRTDALDDPEITALAKAIDQQARISPRFRKYLVVALEATSGGQLLSVCLVITARRFARHGIMLPVEADAMLGNMLGNITNTPSMTPIADLSDAPEMDAPMNGSQPPSADA